MSPHTHAEIGRLINVDSKKVWIWAYNTAKADLQKRAEA